MNNLDKFSAFYKKHKGEVTGAVIGFLIGILIIILGFFKALFLSVCVFIGYYIGKKLMNDKDYIKNLLDRILPPGSFR